MYIPYVAQHSTAHTHRGGASVRANRHGPEQNISTPTYFLQREAIFGLFITLVARLIRGQRRSTFGNGERSRKREPWFVSCRLGRPR